MLTIIEKLSSDLSMVKIITLKKKDLFKFKRDGSICMIVTRAFGVPPSGDYADSLRSAIFYIDLRSGDIFTVNPSQKVIHINKDITLELQLDT